MTPTIKYTKDSNSQITILITSFKRDECVDKILKSIGDRNVSVVVVDTGGNLSAGRNFGVQACKTKYIIIAEEDFEFDNNTNFDTWVKILNHDPSVKVVGGRLRNNGLYEQYASDMEISGRTLTIITP